MFGVSSGRRRAPIPDGRLLGLPSRHRAVGFPVSLEVPVVVVELSIGLGAGCVVHRAFDDVSPVTHFGDAEGTSCNG